MGKICGIDLGTTNSLIGYGDELYTDLVSSSIDITTKSQVERDVYNKNIVSSYKVDMTVGESGQVPIICSSIILRELVDRAMRVTGEFIDEVVISVPAKFSHTQRQAVYEAASKAGLTVYGLINEPTAAAIYTCRDRKELITVFDLGGGTFDVTILDSRAGNYFTVATDGEGRLAGDNLDKAIVDTIIEEAKIKIRYLTDENKENLRIQARKAKETIQKTGLPQYINLSKLGCLTDWCLTEEKYVELMKSVFKPTLDMTQHLIRTYLMETDEPKLVFVGGSTACPYLREWISSELGLEVIEHSTPPDLIVAKGVALYAKMVQDGTAAQEVDDVTKCLCIENNLGMAEVVIEKNTIIPISEVRIFDNTEDTRYLNINLYQGDSILCKDNEYIGTLVYDYGCVRPAHTGVVEVEITVNRDGRVSLLATDITTCDTQEIALVLR